MFTNDYSFPPTQLLALAIKRNDNNTYNKTNNSNNDKIVLIIRKIQVDWYSSLLKSTKSLNCIHKEKNKEK